VSTYTIFGEDGLIRVLNAYRYDTAITLEIVRGGEVEQQRFDRVDQFAGEIAYFSDCILKDSQPEPSGIEGLQDVRVVEAIYRSSRDGRPVTLPRLARVDAAPSPEQEMRKLASDRRQAS
jgi:glucose-fructose oxidoreductase